MSDDDFGLISGMDELVPFPLRQREILYDQVLRAIRVYDPSIIASAQKLKETGYSIIEREDFTTEIERRRVGNIILRYPPVEGSVTDETKEDAFLKRLDDLVAYLLQEEGLRLDPEPQEILSERALYAKSIFLSYQRMVGKATLRHPIDDIKREIVTISLLDQVVIGYKRYYVPP